MLTSAEVGNCHVGGKEHKSTNLPKVEGPPKGPFEASELKLEPLGPELLAWFQSRGISKAVLERNRIQQQMRYSKTIDEMVPFAAFPYYKQGQIWNVKYRNIAKKIRQVWFAVCASQRQRRLFNVSGVWPFA